MKGTVTADVLNVRSSTSLNSDIVGKVTKNTPLTIYKEVGDWLEIEYQAKKAYVNKQYVSYKPKTTSNNTSKPTQKVTVYVNDKEISLPVDPVNIQSKLLVPYRALAEALGIDVKWNQSLKQVTAREHNLEVILTINQTEAIVNGKKIQISPAPMIKNSTTLIPLRYFSETFGAEVKWNNSTKTVTIIRPERNDEEQLEGTELIGYVTAKVLNVRNAPSTDSSKIGELSRGTKINIVEIADDWVKFIFNNEIAYVHKDYINVQKEIEVNVPTNPVDILKNKTIVVDPGHGGSDPGAVAFGLFEKDIVLNIGLMLEKKLQASGVNVVMTRKDDRLIPLREISEIANRHNPDSFVSIHINAATSEKAHGTETYWNRTYSSDESKKLAQSIQKQLIANLHSYDRGVKEANFAVIRNTKAPSVLVEIGFITNEEEAKLLNDPIYQELAAEAIYQGLIDYFTQP